MKPHNEFIKEVERETSLPVQAGKYLGEDQQTKSDLAAIKRQDKKSNHSQNPQVNKICKGGDETDIAESGGVITSSGVIDHLPNSSPSDTKKDVLEKKEESQ